MRLWHYKLLHHLPLQHLLGQHRECCALRGNGWGKKHSTVDYVFLYPPSRLYFYHCKVLTELGKLGIQYDYKWADKLYRGVRAEPLSQYGYEMDYTNYQEHNQEYMVECLENLRSKGFLRESRLYYRIGNHIAFRKELIN